ncbi:MAG: hypothetical protein KGL74_07545 [Elusimicrobia bacterium]|nr:hypothetical protein [Elusimicrobiota bacterium]
MRGRALLVACMLAARAVCAAPSPSPTVSIDPPPGWNDVTGKARVRGVILALKGPETSSFILARMPASALESAASTRAFLARTLEQLRAGARADLRSSGRVETKTLHNGITLHLLRADLDGAPRMIIAVVDGGGPPYLGTLSSAAPDAMLAPLFGALKLGAAAGAIRESGNAVSLDGQLLVPLGGGLRSRDLTPEEKRQGAVLAVQGAGSEVLFLKIEDDDASPKDQSAIVRAVVSDSAKTAPDAVSPARRVPTPAGPSGVYAWAKIPSSPDLKFSAGFLPWAYWGYSILGRGPQADELLVGSLAALKAGPSAVPKLLAATPRLEIPEDGRGRRAPLVVLGVVAVLGLLFAWSRRQKNANLPS